MSLVTWLGYSLYLHLRIKPGFPAEKLSLIAVAAMMLTLLTYLGFNALGFGGMHGYGTVK
jgi:ABC-type transport system involved in cytochrome c biogenesis permease subunit